jgi:hypothetical protein
VRGNRQGRGHTLIGWRTAGRRARAHERIGAVMSESPDASSLRLQVLAVLREVIDFDAYVWLLSDPVTAVGAAPLADVPCLPELPALIRAKYATPVNRWTVLQRAEVTRRHPERCHRRRTASQPAVARCAVHVRNRRHGLGGIRRPVRLLGIS